MIEANLRKRFRRAEDGASAVEFGLLLPLLVTVVLGAIEFGLILFTQVSAENAARDVARRLATNRLASADASKVAIDQLPGWVKASASVSVTQTAPSTPSTNLFVVSITIPATKAAITGFLGWSYKDSMVRSKVTYQQEPTT